MYPSEYSTSWMKGVRRVTEEYTDRTWEREILDVFAQYRRVSSVVALAEEISFTDGLVGERSVKRGGGQRHTKNQKQGGDETSDVRIKAFLREV